jgi:hypothetical protein
MADFTPDARRRIAAAVKKVEATAQQHLGYGGHVESWTDEILAGKFPATITKGSTGLFNVYRGTTKGSETYTALDDKQVYCRLGDGTLNKWTYIVYRAGGWELLEQEC